MQYLVKVSDYSDYYETIEYLQNYYHNVQHHYGDIIVTTDTDVFHEVAETVKRCVKHIAFVEKIGTQHVAVVTPNPWYRVTVHAHDASDMLLVRDLFVTHKPMCDSTSLTVTFYQTSADGKRIAQYIAERIGGREININRVYYGDTRRRNVYKVTVSDAQYAAVMHIAKYMDVYRAPHIQRNEITFTANMKVASMRRLLRNIGELSFVVNGKKTYKTR
jgi:GGDEF domain-containing protein